jgi:hypothetical protein
MEKSLGVAGWMSVLAECLFYVLPTALKNFPLQESSLSGSLFLFAFKSGELSLVIRITGMLPRSHM